MNGAEGHVHSESQHGGNPALLVAARTLEPLSFLSRATLRRRIALRPKLVASYFSALLVLSVGVVAVVQNHEAEAALARADALRATIRGVLETHVLLLEAETGQRGYLLTGDPNYRRPYDRAAQGLERQLATLARLLRTEPDQRVRLDAFRQDARARLAELGAALRVRDAGGDALALVKDEKGRELDERIARETEILIHGARAARDAATERAAARYTFLRWFTGVGNAFAFALAVAITLWIARAFRESQADRLEVERHALALERSTHLLEDHERLLAARLHEEHRLTLRLARSNAALQKSNADLEFFAYMASHDLRAPLRGIANVSEWIEQDLGAALPADTKRHMDALRGRVHRLEALIAAIAAYARAGKREVEVEAIDLEELVQELAEALARPAGVELVRRAPLPRVHSLRQPLQQVLSNLISNAIKHGSTHGGSVELELEDQPDAWRFTVLDHGPGIAPEYHAKIFGLFQTLAARDRVEGTGIGLAIVKKLVDQYGGTIALFSVPGQGARFVLTWPKRISRSEAEADA